MGNRSPIPNTRHLSDIVSDMRGDRIARADAIRLIRGNFRYEKPPFDFYDIDVIKRFLDTCESTPVDPVLLAQVSDNRFNPEV